ncbi:MAG: glycosyltransferase [Actinomycetota bacterium]
MTPTIEAVLVVVPARDEELLLGACLDSVAVASGRVEVPVVTVVVLDRCTDGTENVLRGRDVVSVRTTVGCVGGARGAGVHEGLRRLTATAADRVWIANTDADSVVPEQWLADHLEQADGGADLLLGTVDIVGAPATLVSAWSTGYTAADGHPHVHGANLGVRGSAYLRAGGFDPVAVHEDVRLVTAVGRDPGAVVLRTSAAPVATSGRLEARAPDGFAAHLRRLAAS